MQERISSKII